MKTSPFKINIALHIPDDLKRRLKNSRWPDEIANSRWENGKPIKYLKPQKTLKKFKILTAI